MGVIDRQACHSTGRTSYMLCRFCGGTGTSIQLRF